MHNKGINRFILCMVIIFVTIVVLIYAMPKNLKNVYSYNYVVDSFCILLCEILLLKLYIRNRLDMFEPIAIISLIYIMMYFVTPIYDIVVGDFLWYGYELFEYGVEASIIAFIGYLAFYITYTKNFKFRQKKVLYAKEKSVGLIIKNRSLLLITILIMYAFCFAANAVYLIKYTGNDLLYILSLGLLGNGSSVESTESSIGFISMFSYCLPAITLLYWEFGKSKICKICLFVPMLMLQVARGFRFFVIQIALTFFAYYYIKRGKRPKIISIFIFLLVIMIPVILMTLFRSSIRAGTGMDLSIVSTESINDAFEGAVWDNFRVYKNFYGMVDAIPSRYGYVFLRQILIGTVVMVIPRIIWPGKISSYGGVGLVELIGNNIASGQAYPNLGEYYYAFGVFGVIVFMAIYGWWMKYTRNKYMNRHDGLDLIVFSVLLGCNLQLIIRGYTPSNFWYVVFSVLPVWLVRKLGIVKSVVRLSGKENYE